MTWVAAAVVGRMLGEGSTGLVTGLPASGLEYCFSTCARRALTLRTSLMSLILSVGKLRWRNWRRGRFRLLASTAATGLTGGAAEEEEEEEEEEEGRSGREVEEVGATDVEEVPGMVEVGSMVEVGRVGMKGGVTAAAEGRMGGGGMADVL